MSAYKNSTHRNRLSVKKKLVRNKINHQIQYRRGSTTGQVLKRLQGNKPEEVEVKKFDKGVNKPSQRMLNQGSEKGRNYSNGTKCNSSELSVLRIQNCLLYNFRIL